MNGKLSQKDYELINSYLDQELSQNDVVKFAERMVSDEAVSREVSELMKVKSMIKELPTVNPPRNYILTRSMAENARPKPFWERLFPVFRTAAAFCALALVFSFIFPFIQQSSISKSETQITQTESAMDVVLYEEAAEAPSAYWDQEIVLEDRAFGGSADESYNAVMPSYGVRGGNPRIEYMLRMEESQNAMNKSVSLDPNNPPEGFVSIETAAASQRDLAVKIVLVSGLVFFLTGLYFLTRKRKEMEVR